MVATGAPVLTLGRALRARYGRTLRRLMLDLGGTCPNRDGTLGRGGCIYCDPAGSGTGAAPRLSLEEQWRQGLARLRRRLPEGPCAIAYLQSYSNTWPDLQPLARAVEFLANQAEAAPILAVGTRPDCFGEAAADLLAAARDSFQEVWVELGLETADDRVQVRIGRHDSLASFHAACDRARRHGLRVVAHTIAGLPGAAEDDLLQQVRECNRAGVAGIKFHQLMVLRRTVLATWWQEGRVRLLSAPEYVQRVADALEELHPAVVVHRLVAQAPAAELLAPRDWPGKATVHEAILAELRRRGRRQGLRGGGW